MEKEKQKVNIKYLSKSLMMFFNSVIDVDDTEFIITSPELKNTWINVDKGAEEVEKGIGAESKSSKGGGILKGIQKAEVKGINQETLDKMRKIREEKIIEEKIIEEKDDERTE